jgi:23S rRNA (adenine2503-C2)-methyltransferase
VVATPLSALLLEPERLAAVVAEQGGRPFHGRILREQVLGAGVLDYAAMTSLPARLREALAERHPVLGGRELGRSRASDATCKLLLGFPSRTEGAAPDAVETVHIPSRKEGRGATLCVSTQVGCPVACPFCASGRAGLVRNLEAWEILEQYLAGRALGPLARSVVMGIGEPLLNLKALSAALRVVHDDLGLGARRVTVSTVGFPERLRAAALERPPFQLAISLHTPFDEERDELVPAMRGTPVEEVLAAGDHWFEVTGREVTYEYVLLGGTNDTAEHAEALVRRLAGRRCTVNLIPFNPVEESPYGRPESGAVGAFRGRLEQAGVVATVRWSRGLESDAACGQLRLRSTQTG